MARFGSLCLWLAALALTAGCFNSSRPDSDPLDKALMQAEHAKAIQLACDRARKDGILTEGNYSATVTRMPDCWWVRFDALPTRPTRGWPAHFVVEVYHDNQTVLFKGKEVQRVGNTPRTIR